MNVYSKEIWLNCIFFSDACDPSWHSSRDGLTYSAFAISIVASIFTANLICVHIYWHWDGSEELVVFLCHDHVFSDYVLALFPGPAFVEKRWEEPGNEAREFNSSIRNQSLVTKLVLSIQRTGKGLLC